MLQDYNFDLYFVRQSCIGSELVDWLLKCCTFIKSRSTATGVWQLLLNMGIVFTGQFYSSKCNLLRKTFNFSFFIFTGASDLQYIEKKIEKKYYFENSLLLSYICIFHILNNYNDIFARYLCP